ncbi:DUF3782 domain-containing protein [Thermofilum pendens]|uniref:DUF3782 domain-containing protein n=1 Tax=Thermofilum pendens (strain DSM 2475 / Hrk 5) TaxID=368408 RepID=A1S0X0_THEPD|nr:DUF3782 domain-containing protein [Thermofilum pendens]ABL79100.1 conserved hypothetical protein [Thermofilum pendens Hrk 5]
MAIPSIDWSRLEEVVERAVRRARADELRDLAEAVKVLAEYMKTGFESTLRAIEDHSKMIEELTKEVRNNSRILEEHSKVLGEHSRRIEELAGEIRNHSRVLEEHSKRLEELTREVRNHSRILEEHSERLKELTKSVGELKAAVGSIGRRWGRDLEKLVYELYKDALLGLGVKDVGKIEKYTYVDIDGKYYRRGARIELDIYMHDTSVYFIEVKSLLEVDDVYWFNEKCGIVSKIIGRTPTRRIIVAVNAAKEAIEAARELGIDVVYGSIVD